MKQIKIYTIGGATFDMFVKAHNHAVMLFKTLQEETDWICFDKGAKVRIDEVHETFGGGATNTAVGFARMGFDVSFVGKVGAMYGDKVIQNLEKEGVDVHCVKKTNRDKTAFSTILNTFEGDRTVLAYAGANQYFTAKDLPVDELMKADWIFLNHLTEKKSKIPAEILKILKKNPRIKLAWNPGREQIEQGVKRWKNLLTRTEILFLNKEEASQFTRKPYGPAGVKHEDPKFHGYLPKTFLPPYADDVTEIMLEFFKYGANKIVITDGPNGAQASDGKKLYFCPIVSHKRVDTTGAGDSFATGFTSAIILGENLKGALKYGAINSHNVIQFFGAQEGLLTREKLNKMKKKLDICVNSTRISALK
jgi:sugar/nucleoside kinase (ribokinase family)